MDIFEQIVKHREHFINIKGYCPGVVYLGIDEALTLVKWVEDNLPYILDVAEKPRSQILGMDIYVVDAVSHMTMV